METSDLEDAKDAHAIKSSQPYKRKAERMHSPQTTDVESSQETSKGTHESKVRRISGEGATMKAKYAESLTHNTVPETSVISANEGEHDAEPAHENVQEPKTTGCSEMVVLGASEALVQKNADVSHRISNESGHETHASTRIGIEDTVVLDGNTRKSSVDISSRSDILCLESRVENSVDTVAANLDCPKSKDSGSIPSNKECELSLPEGDETKKDSTKSADRISNTDISKSSNLELLSSDVWNQQTTVVEGCVNDSACTQQGLGVHLAGDVSGVSSQVIKENLPHAQAEISATVELLCGSSEQDGKRHASPASMDTSNVETLTAHLESESVGEDNSPGIDDKYARERSNLALPGIPTSNLPDMNASAFNKSNSTSTTPRQLFTKLQLDQLEAQMLVYESLIQDTTPDLTQMILVFQPSSSVAAEQIDWRPVWSSQIQWEAEEAVLEDIKQEEGKQNERMHLWSN